MQTIGMNPVPVSASASRSKDEASIEAVPLKFDAQLSISIICDVKFPLIVVSQKEMLAFKFDAGVRYFLLLISKILQ